MTPHLTRQQTRVLHLRAQGLPVKQVAERLGVTYQTAKNHNLAAYRTLQVDNLASALIAIGIIKLEDIA